MSVPGKRVSTSLLILAACVLGVAIGLFGLNYWHATKCAGGKEPEEIEKYVEALNRRLLSAESQVSLLLFCALFILSPLQY
jgi:hypothetical protein